MSSSSASSRSVSEGDSCYMPNELMQFNTSSLDLTKADIFSLGASIFEVIRGKRLPKRGKEWHTIRSGVLKFDQLAKEDQDKALATAKTPVASPQPHVKSPQEM